MPQLATETFEGSPGGMNLALPAQSLDDSEARYIQDGLVDLPGITRRRGPLTTVGGLPAHTKKGTGLTGTTNPAGDFILGVLNGDDDEGYFSVYSVDRSSKVDLTWPHSLPDNAPTQPKRYFDSKPMLNGGALIGVSNSYRSNTPDQGLALWRGGNKANYTTGTITFTRGATTVTGSGTSWQANLSPGMFLFSNTDDPYTSAYIGVIQKILSDTSLVLEKPAPYAATAKAYTVQSLRGFIPRVSKGRITCDTTSTVIVGANTKFSSQGLGSGAWHMYRASDDAFIGKVSAVTNDQSVTLAANAAVSCSNERYYALKADGDASIITTANPNKVGFITALYAERQWYGNNGSSLDKTERVWFSEPSGPEDVDLSNFDGDFIPITSSTGSNDPIVALVSCANSLLVLKEREAFGIFGSSPTNFAVRKLQDDGALCGSSAVSYGSGAIWAGLDGIHYFDGFETKNIIEDKLGQYYKDAVEDFDNTKNRMYGFVHRDHYILYIDSFTPSVVPIKAAVSSGVSRITIVINLVTRSVTMFTNIDHLSGIQLPTHVGGDFYYLINDSTKAVVCTADQIFDNDGIDAVACAGNTIGPDFYFESKKFSAADPLRRKSYKYLSMHYFVSDGDLKLDTVRGLNNVGQTSVSVFPSAGFTWSILGSTFATWADLGNTYPTWASIDESFYTVKKIKFQKRSQFFSFRLYQSTSAITKVIMGPYQIGFKLQRVGKV